MAEHFLAIQHESYDASIVYGVFDTFIAARDYLEAEAAKPGAYYYAKFAEIEAWDRETQTANYARDSLKPTVWKEKRYNPPTPAKD